ncbi:MAG: hypothetical protein H6P99_597 [Holophagaceae bacterium]|nr:hypothetical protein [Holophagaceae bacterium]
MEIRTDTPQVPYGTEAPDVGQLRHAIRVWGKAAPEDPTANGQFLSTFAVFLVKHLREEEARLARGRAQDGVKRRMAHRRLVERLDSLMGDLALGLDVDLGIRAFIRAWQAHQETAALRGAAEEPGH